MSLVNYNPIKKTPMEQSKDNNADFLSCAKSSALQDLMKGLITSQFIMRVSF